MSNISKVKFMRDLLLFLGESGVQFALKSVRKRKQTVTATVEVSEQEAGFFLVFLCGQDYRGVDFSCTPTQEGCQVEITFPLGFFEF
jgi:hypothetical protein